MNSVLYNAVRFFLVVEVYDYYIFTKKFITLIANKSLSILIEYVNDSDARKPNLQIF